MNSVLDRGVFILSLDTELAWGSVHSGKYAQRQPLFKKTRPCISGLLKLLERYRIHATWAFVGHLLLDRCQPVNGVRHPEIIRPEYSWHPQDWFISDPCANLETAPHWYGRDILEQVLECPVSQEIGCHTFSHIRAGEPGCSRECFSSELKACQAIADKLGLTLRSFVFPRNSAGHLDVLKERGYVTYRGFLPPSLNHLPRIVRAPMYRLKAGPTCLPEQMEGLWNLPGCLFYPPSKGLYLSPLVAFQVWKAGRALDNAAQEHRMFHLWFHPFNLAVNPAALLGGLEKIFAKVNRLREAGRLDNLTMGEMADALNKPKEHSAGVLSARPDVVQDTETALPGPRPPQELIQR